MKNLSINYKKTIFKPLFLTVRFTMLSANINEVIKNSNKKQGKGFKKPKQIELPLSMEQYGFQRYRKS